MVAAWQIKIGGEGKVWIDLEKKQGKKVVVGGV